MSNALATNVLVNQQLPNNNVNSLNRTNDDNDDHLHLTPTKYFKSSNHHLPSIKRPSANNHSAQRINQDVYFDQSIENNKFAVSQNPSNKRANCMQLTNLDSITVGSQQAPLNRGDQQRNQQQQSACQNYSTSNRHRQTTTQNQVYQATNDSSYNCSTSVGSRPNLHTKHNTDTIDRGLIRKGIKRPNDTDRDAKPVLVESIHCDLIPQSSQQQATTTSAIKRGLEASEVQEEADDSDEECAFDYEIVLTKILNEKKLALSNSPEVLKFLSSIRKKPLDQQRPQEIL